MTNIIFAIGGIIFVMLAMPIIQSISDIFSTLAQMLISKMNIAIMKNNVEVQNIQEQCSPSNSNLIGFQMDDCDEGYCDENSDVEDKINKIGF